MHAAQLARQDRPAEVQYPDSDGMPMAENTLQFQWIVTLKENLDALLPDFVAGDLLWYPIEGDNKTRQAPDVLVALGRPKGRRGSYKQWVEDGVAPQVVFEVLSPGNTLPEMYRKILFYAHHGVEEYYVYDPDDNVLSGWIRRGSRLIEIESMDGWVSPLLGIRFQPGEPLEVYRPDGRRFLTFGELMQQAEDAQRQAEDAQKQAEDAQKQAAEATRQRDEALSRADALAAKLRALGLDPDAP